MRCIARGWLSDCWTATVRNACLQGGQTMASRPLNEGTGSELMPDYATKGIPRRGAFPPTQQPLRGTVRGKAFGCLGLLVLALGVATPAWATVGRIAATVSTTVQERIDDAPASVSNDAKTLDPDAPEAPVGVVASLTSTDLQGHAVSMGQGFSDFADPTRLDQPNPEEFGVEVACFSSAESIAYIVDGSAVETRSVVFLASEIRFDDDGTQTVESRIYVSGAIVLWATERNRDLSEMLAHLTLTVTREDTEATLFQAGLELVGASDARVLTTPTGPIQAEEVGLDALVEEGADVESIATLERVRDEGSLVIVLIPPQVHTYTYDVTADEPFNMIAALEARVRNVPGGTGVALVAGRPFENLAAFVERGLPGVDGHALERAVNEATAKRQIDASASGRAAGRLCGAFGLEFGALAGLSLFGVFRLHLRGGRSIGAASPP